MDKVYWHFTPLWSRKKMQYYSQAIGLGQSRINRLGYCLTIACMYLEIVFGIVSTCIYAFANVPEYIKLNFIWQGLTAVAILIVNLALVGDIHSVYYRLGYTIWFAIDTCMCVFDTFDAWSGTKEIHTIHSHPNIITGEGLWGEFDVARVQPLEAVCITIDALLVLGILIGYIMTHWKVAKPSVSRRDFKLGWREYRKINKGL